MPIFSVRKPVNFLRMPFQSAVASPVNEVQAVKTGIGIHAAGYLRATVKRKVYSPVVPVRDTGKYTFTIVILKTIIYVSLPSRILFQFRIQADLCTRNRIQVITL